MIDFQPGYSEWYVSLDGEIVYTFNDLVDQIPDSLTSQDDLEDTVDDLIEEMQWELDTGEKEIDTYVKEDLYECIDELKELMIKRLFHEYGEAA